MLDRHHTQNTASPEAAVLLLVPIGRDAALSADKLRRAELPYELCASPADLIERIHRGGGPAVIAAEALGAEHTAAIEKILSDQPIWSELPLVLLAGQAMVPRHLHPLVERRNTTLLHRPLKVATFITTVRAALQSRLRQYEIRDLLRRLEDRMRQLQRLALEVTQSEERERRRLAKLLHDDLQQVLAGTKLHVALVANHAKQGRLDDAIEALSGLLDEAIEKARSLSHELSPPVLRQHGLSAALEWLSKRMHRLHKLQVELDAAPDAEPPDEQIRIFLYQSARELLFNVIKHAGVADARLRLTAEGDSVVLSVQDQGRGFDPQALQQGSAGLGLISIRERASLLGGSLDVSSSPGEGSTFTLSLPIESSYGSDEAADPAEEALQIVELSGKQETSPRVRIVLADDHRVMRKGLCSLLEGTLDLEVVAEAGDGLRAVELADRLRPDLILMDLSMPRMDGLEATRRIKARHPGIRVIGLSMFDDEQSARKMLEAGAEGYLLKTGPHEELLAAVRGVVGS